MSDGDRLRGASPATVRRALDDRDPLPGTGGFAGVIDGEPVRDVLGRQPLFVDGDAVAADPKELDDPESVPPGTWGGRTVWELPDPDPYEDVPAAVGAIRTALGARSPAADAVGFSGGVDSALVASLVDAPLYVAGYPDAGDVAAAQSAAATLDRSVTVVALDDETVAAAVGRVAAAIDRTDPMAVSIALPLVLTADRAAADGAERLAVGQGADELFGGYEKVARAPTDDRLSATSVRAAARETVRTLPAQLERDTLALRSVGVDPVTPFLHDDVVAAALRLDASGLVSSAGERKWALRLAAREVLPDRLAFRPKRAVQYGSGVARGLERLAADAGHDRSHAGLRAYVRERRRAFYQES